MNVLLFATDPVLPEFVRRPLAPLGHTLEVVDSLAAFERRLAGARPDVVLLPRRLPDAPVAEVVAWLRRQKFPREATRGGVNGGGLDPARGDGQVPSIDEAAIPTVIIGVQPADRDVAREVRADGFLLVPFSDNEVLDVVGATARAKKLIVLADDSPLIHRHTVPILEEAGYEVISAHDGADALRAVREHQPDLLITDVEMPKLDGFELCKTVKDDPATAHMPVLICSTLGEAQDLERGFDSGADDYLVKPVIPEELITRVRALFVGTIPASREKVLVVDDSPALRHYVADCLSRQGFEVSTAENGRIGLEKAQAIRPALVVSDYEMPEMTGFEMVHALRRDPELRNTPVIMLTARDSKRDMAQMRAAGASAYLVKPFGQDKCIATVERTLAERRLMAYKEASSLYISEGARRAAEQRAAAGDLGAVRADEREMAVIFSDLVGFTMMSQQLSPRQVITLLNSYFDRMCPMIVDEAGDIDKFIGDAIMAVFDQVRGKAQPAERAVRAALAMQAALVDFNVDAAVPLQMRIGVNTGPLVRGDLGSRYVRRDYTVIGDTVNRANRYETRCPPGGVLVSQSTRDRLGDLVEVTAVPGLELKGVVEPVVAYVVHSIAPAKEPS